MFDSYSIRAKQVLFLARLESGTRGAEMLDLDDLLAGLIIEDQNAIPSALKVIVVPIYLVLLLAAAILAGLVIRQGIINARTIRAQSRSSSTIKSNGTSTITERADDDEDIEQNAANLERRRERRRNAAAARRRRSGKA